MQHPATGRELEDCYRMGCRDRIGRKFVDGYHPALAAYKDVRGQHAELLTAPDF